MAFMKMKILLAAFVAVSFCFACVAGDHPGLPGVPSWVNVTTNTAEKKPEPVAPPQPAPAQAAPASAPAVGYAAAPTYIWQPAVVTTVAQPVVQPTVSLEISSTWTPSQPVWGTPFHYRFDNYRTERCEINRTWNLYTGESRRFCERPQAFPAPWYRPDPIPGRPFPAFNAGAPAYGGGHGGGHGGHRGR